MNKQELNKKLAEWVGLDWTITFEFEDEHGYCHPLFTDSLDACFAWLVPKLKRWRIANYPSGNMSSYGLIRVFVTTGDWNGTAEDKDPALALCLAIEKLIDGGK